jgi:site-specific DNA-cytosine methylase
VKALDLFCGAGGASSGLHRAGYDVIGYDHWARAVETHVANGLPAVVHDLSDPDMDHLLPECDLLWASPPCQPFSAAGDQAGEFDDRDGFPWLLRIVARLLPPVCIVENVKGLTFATHADYFGRILEQFTRLGYAWQWRVLNSADYGVPQTRERCFIVARRDGGPIVWPAPTHTQGDSLFLEPWVTMAQALGWDDGRVLDSNADRGVGMRERHGERAPTPLDEPAPCMVSRTDTRWRWVLRAGSPTNVAVRTLDEPAPPVLANHDMTGWQFQLVRDDDNGRPAKRAVGFADVPSGSLDQQELDILEQLDGIGVGRDGDGERVNSHADHSPQPALDVNWPHHRPATTIAGDTRVFQPGGHHQPGEQSQNAIRLTIAELATLQGFPPDWQWCGTKTDQARQVGNAVCPVMAERLASHNRPIVGGSDAQ